MIRTRLVENFKSRNQEKSRRLNLCGSACNLRLTYFAVTRE
jgi:hypothetical protein